MYPAAAPLPSPFVNPALPQPNPGARVPQGYALAAALEPPTVPLPGMWPDPM
jgi:hypothetical protein